MDEPEVPRQATRPLTLLHQKSATSVINVKLLHRLPFEEMSIKNVFTEAEAGFGGDSSALYNDPKEVRTAHTRQGPDVHTPPSALFGGDCLQ